MKRAQTANRKRAAGTSRFSRRRMLGGTLGGFLSFAARHPIGRLAAADGDPQTASGSGVRKNGPAKRVVVLWMNGGPSQFETFDPKPGTGTGGDAESIATSVPGLHISSTLPEIAARMDRFNVIRNLTSTEGEHERAQYFMHTGYPFVEAFPRPALGSMASHEMPASDIPNYVSLGSAGFGPAWLGPEHAPFSIEDPEHALQLLNQLRRRRRRLEFLQELTSDFDRRHSGEALQRRRGMVKRIERLVDTPFVRALDVRRETESRRAAYGDEPFGRRCLIARRLLETGVRFVEIRQDGWDTHQNNHNQVKRLCERIDRPWALLVDELQEAGLLDETIVLWLGEFGRTPRINAQSGRDHFPSVTPAVIGGGGLQAGQVIGSTNSSGTSISGEPCTAADLFATILNQLGIDPAHEFRTNFNSPAAATDSGTPIAELV